MVDPERNVPRRGPAIVGARRIARETTCFLCGREGNFARECDKLRLTADPEGEKPPQAAPEAGATPVLSSNCVRSVVVQ